MRVNCFEKKYTIKVKAKENNGSKMNLPHTFVIEDIYHIGKIIPNPKNKYPMCIELTIGPGTPQNVTVTIGEDNP